MSTNLGPLDQLRERFSAVGEIHEWSAPGCISCSTSSLSLSVPSYVGQKGAFIFTSDGNGLIGKSGNQWPSPCGMELYHITGSPVDPNRLYASQSGGWFGQLSQRSEAGDMTNLRRRI